jgi:hypothetical protein
VTVSQSTGATLYGKRIGGPSLAASIVLGASGDWVGKKALRTSVDGQIPAAGGKATNAQAIQNALATNGASLHRFLDKLQSVRARALAKEFIEAKRAERKAAATPGA